MSKPTVYTDETAYATRSVEVAGASWLTGCHYAASCSPGIGINIDDGAVVGTPEQFTLLDQNGNARNPQIGEAIGGIGLNSGGASPSVQPVYEVSNPAGGGGNNTKIGISGAVLATLGAGWTSPLI